MTVVDPINPQPQMQNVEQRPQGLPPEPHLPAGKPLRSVQTMPLPLINPREMPKDPQDEQALHRQVAMNRAGITGTGLIVDTIA
ncbi:MAG: hypothetical protein RDU24_03760 [Humidesulfovibrio sp.]|uniref:hypothetical protein n=1 Tax=Humidesulfovibrio sp. TaxID=2910988 RepID=UPI0027FF19AD|nr:hypothetical protein [Humidesulfovibrio sp.]MDQ7834474.1 hypothetical protein [Humidesulfovibrio sp.]